MEKHCLFIFDIYISIFLYQHVNMLFQETLANRLMEIYCRSHIQLEGDSYHIWFFYALYIIWNYLLSIIIDSYYSPSMSSGCKRVVIVIINIIIIICECSIFDHHWGIHTICATHLRNKYEVPPGCPIPIVLALALFHLYFPCLSFMKCVDVSSCYFFLIVIMNKLNISLMMLCMLDGFHSAQTHCNTEFITFFWLHIFCPVITWSNSKIFKVHPFSCSLFPNLVYQYHTSHSHCNPFLSSHF